MPDTLTIVDNRTGKSYEVPVQDGTIRTADLRQIKVNADDFGLMGYDPAFMNTASCKSSITYIDGDKGILRYRGYPIEQLAEKSTFLETAYLLIHGELPTQAQLDTWTQEIMQNAAVPENVKPFTSAFRTDAHPMGMLESAAAFLSTFHPESKKIDDAAVRHQAMVNLIAKMPTLAAYGYRHRRGLSYVEPDSELSYAGNFMNMMWNMTGGKYQPNPVLERALDILFILHADHEQNCSTSTMRTVGSSHADPYSSLTAATAALYGPLHGGANEAVLKMLAEIGSKDQVPGFLKRVVAGEARLMGFGHRVYKNYDPRAKIIKRIADEVFEVTGTNPLIDVARELERIALEDEYFVKRKLYPNVDFYSGIIYKAMGFPEQMFTVLFAIPRTSGWVAQWQELVQDNEQKITRPRQVYTGADTRDFVEMDKR